jgi:hypothetical protein
MTPEIPSDVDQPFVDQPLRVQSPEQTATIAVDLLNVALPQVVATAVRSLPDPADWLARVITDAARRELLANVAVTIALNTHSIDPVPSSNTDLPPRRGSHPDAEPDLIPVGSLVRNSLRWLGIVQAYNPDTGRYLVAFKNGILREFPRYLLTFVALEPE